VAVGVEDGLNLVAGGQTLTFSLTVSIILSCTVSDEVGSRIDKRPGLRIGTGERGFPEGAQKVDGSWIIGI